MCVCTMCVQIDVFIYNLNNFFSIHLMAISLAQSDLLKNIQYDVATDADTDTLTLVFSRLDSLPSGRHWCTTKFPTTIMQH